VELQVVMSSGIRVSDSTCDKIFFVSFSLTLCTFSPRPLTNFDSCNKPQLNIINFVINSNKVHVFLMHF